ncbi:hypothetical protein EST38_g457 [Candolleomyces aberdarensis]|uniref:tRNA (guanine(9)-N1)-methyltransferase n=1 Tax=Candolleomyces aberdarensis TaxID=2316362 RepID=A0A4Q2DXZ7_9AGAR|nr:hypothetical protein EST38_g457 [Candolleomyces aberdarensis]
MSEQQVLSQAPSPSADPPGPSAAGSTLPPSLSKNAAKRAAKQERYAATKLERRAREKEAKKEKKRLKAEKRAAGELDDDDEQDQSRKQKRRRLEFGGRVVVDLGFDALMSSKVGPSPLSEALKIFINPCGRWLSSLQEIKSLSSQLAYTYSANRNASFPFDLLFTSLDGQTLARLESLGDAGYKRWTSTEWWEEGFDRLWAGQRGSRQPSGVSAVSSGDQGGSTPAASSSQEDSVAFVPSPAHNPEDPQESTHDIRQKIVYLTADSEEELTVLDPEETYIIGGICDHNRYKNLCLNKAKEHGVRTAKLPIGRYLASLPTRKVLTVNQCFEILVKWVETKDWEEALYAVIPKRKFQAGDKTQSDDLPVVAGGYLVDERREGEDRLDEGLKDGALGPQGEFEVVEEEGGSGRY